MYLAFLRHFSMDSRQILKLAELYAEAADRSEYMREYMKNRYHNKRSALVKALGGKCSRCGNKEGPFHIDHIDRRKKKFRAADVHTVSDELVQKSLGNLQLLCVPCHAEKTRESWDYGMPKPKHGSYWRYRRYGCRCPACVKAYREKNKEWNDRRKELSETL
jgi:hypothetical protein